MADDYFPGGLSPFRAGFLKLALFIGGVWVDVPMTELSDAGVRIKRGRRAGGVRGEPGSCTFTLKDPTGKWSPRHPASPYYGQIGRGTLVRVQVELAAGVVWDRYYGEVATWQPRWTRTGAKDAVVDVEAAGAIRRLDQGQSPLRSPLYRACSTLGADLVAYWPMEDGSLSAGFAGVIGKPARVAGKPSFAAYSGVLGSDPLPVLGTGQVAALVPTYTNLGTAQCQVRWTGMIPAATPTNSILVRLLFTGGTLDYVDVTYSSGGGIKVEGFKGGVSAGSSLYGMGLDGLKLRYSLEFSQSGANVAWTFGQLESGATFGLFGSGTFTAVTLGRCFQVWVNPNVSALAGLAFGHLTVERAVTSLFTVASEVLAGYLGEPATDRISRLCTENGVTVAVVATDPVQPMGVQTRADVLTLLRECEATDGGMLYEPKSTDELGYRTGASLWSQTPTTIAYVENMLSPFEPVEDGDATRNRVTVTRIGGSSATVEQTAGTLGTAAVGVYDEDVQLSLETDDDALQQAGWRVHVGTHDEARWPVVGFDLADPRVTPTVRDKVLGLSLGGRLDVTGLPAWLPPFSVSQIVQGYSEQITAKAYKIAFDCSPARPYRVATWGGASDRYSGEGTVLAAAITTTTATTFSVTLPAGLPGWTHADGDYDVVIGGEVMTVTNVVGTLFTVVRSVNGVAKTHLAGTAVQLADPCYYGF